MSSEGGLRRSSVQHAEVKTPDYVGRLKQGHPSSAGKRGVLHLGCRARMTANRCFWSKHGTRTKLLGGRSPNRWRKRWVNKTLSSIFCPVRRLLEPSKAQMTIFPRPLTTHKVDYARIAGELRRCTSAKTRTKARSGPFSVLRNGQNDKNTEFPTQRRGLKHQTSVFLLRTSLNVVLDQET